MEQSRNWKSQIVISNSCLKCQIGISKYGESKWGLWLVRESLLRGWKGAGVEGSFAGLTANVPGTVRVDIGPHRHRPPYRQKFREVGVCG